MHDFEGRKPGGLTAASHLLRKSNPAEPADAPTIIGETPGVAAGNYSRAPDEREAARLADVLLALRRRGEELTHASIVSELRANTRLLRAADVRGVPVEEVARKAELRAERCRRAAGAPRRQYRNQELMKPRIRAKLAALRAKGVDERFLCGKVAGLVKASTAYVRRVRDEEKRDKANALLRAPVEL